MAPGYRGRHAAVTEAAIALQTAAILNFERRRPWHDWPQVLARASFASLPHVRIRNILPARASFDYSLPHVRMRNGPCCCHSRPCRLVQALIRYLMTGCATVHAAVTRDLAASHNVSVLCHCATLADSQGQGGQVSACWCHSCSWPQNFNNALPLCITST